MRRAILLCVVSALALGLPILARASDWPRFATLNIKFGVVAGHHAMAFGHTKDPLPPLEYRYDPKWHLADLSTSKVRTLEEIAPAKADMLRWVGFATSDAPYRWRLGAGYFWSTAIFDPGGALHNTPLSRMEFSMPPKDDDGRGQAAAPEAETVFAAMIGAPSRGMERFPEPRLPGPRLPRSAEAHFQKVSEQWALWYVCAYEAKGETPHYDFLPLGPRRVMLVTLANGQADLWLYDFRPALYVHSDGARAPVWLGEWEKRAAFPVRFKGPFHLAQVQGAYFFVTDAGSVHLAEESAPAQWTSRAVWDDAQRPVVAMLVEADSARAWAFGKNFYLQLRDKPQPKTCRAISIDPPILGQPFRTVLECAQILYSEGELNRPEGNY